MNAFRVNDEFKRVPGAGQSSYTFLVEGTLDGRGRDEEQKRHQQQQYPPPPSLVVMAEEVRVRAHTATLPVSRRHCPRYLLGPLDNLNQIITTPPSTSTVIITLRKKENFLLYVFSPPSPDIITTFKGP